MTVNLDREFDYTQRDFARVVRLIREHAGIQLNASKEHMVYSRLVRRLRALGIGSFQQYLDMLEAAPADPEWQLFINALTTNLTSFFREPHHFELLRNHMLQHGDSRPYRIWCAASSTGEEPYSLAITAFQCMGSDTARSIELIASDLDTHVLETARQGIYPLERLEKLPIEIKRRFFLKGAGARQGLARVRKEVRDVLEFRQINLLHENWPLSGQFDAVFCRNVMIYFDQSAQRKILLRIAALMKPHALLCVGHSESLHFMGDVFRPCGRTAYHLGRVAAGTEIRA
ncbi:CheR family methyltransferase [Chitinilyticum piscinae]|uniref:Chemotaxis protein methyltransferase n=1 Tax=Chitinilyticum piscinae TaxID=2866724 RepID=A0A8J7K7Z4_9NEIS|nr:CheR family methyltransferase [Chitinilyticum piscinae]MBE9608803.1 chemotaxis protein CheR [Chitinilyticum piscinae]